jgi:hypothetical protein
VISFLTLEALFICLTNFLLLQRSSGGFLISRGSALKNGRVQEIKKETQN